MTTVLRNPISVYIKMTLCLPSVARKKTLRGPTCTHKRMNVNSNAPNMLPALDSVFFQAVYASYIHPRSHAQQVGKKPMGWLPQMWMTWCKNQIQEFLIVTQKEVLHVSNKIPMKCCNKIWKSLT